MRLCLSGKNVLQKIFMLSLIATLEFIGIMYIPVIVGQEPPRVPGVKAGDFFRYGNLTAVWSGGEPISSGIEDWNNTEWIQVEVKTVSGTNVTYEFRMHFKNGSDYIIEEWIDVNSGPKPFSIGEMLSPFFISANLQAGDPVYNTTHLRFSRWIINETISKSYLGTLMEVNHVNITEDQAPNQIVYRNLYWEKKSGVLMEADLIYEYPSKGGTFKLRFEIVLISSTKHYIYPITILDSTYFVAIETDGIINRFGYTNFTFSLDWLSQGTYTNITLPRTLNNTGIKVMYDWMIQGWDETPNISANDTHYFVFGMEPDEGCIVWVCFGEPRIEMDVSAPTLTLGYYVNITGQVTYRGHPMGSMSVWIGWSSGGLPNEISIVPTSEDGTFNVSWIPHATGTFYIIGKLICPWLPDEVDVPESHACLAVSPPFENYVFSVVSNSTISALTFNSTANVLSFSAYGPDGTTGYAKVFISKQLLTDISNLIVYVDGNQTDYTYGSTDNSWTINIVYEHSTHEVQMIIPEFPSAIATFLPVLIALIAIVLLKGKKRTK